MRFPEPDRFFYFEALLNSGERCGTHVCSLHNDKLRRPGANGASCSGSLANLRCGGCFDSECGVKAPLFLPFVTEDRVNLAVGAKNACHWSHNAGNRLIQCILNGRLSGSVPDEVVYKSRSSLYKPAVAWRRFYCTMSGHVSARGHRHLIKLYQTIRNLSSLKLQHTERFMRTEIL